MPTLIIWIVIIGLIVGAVYRWAPIPAGFKTLVYIVCVIWLVLLILQVFGVSLSMPPSPHVHG